MGEEGCESGKRDDAKMRSMTVTGPKAPEATADIATRLAAVRELS